MTGVGVSIIINGPIVAGLWFEILNCVNILFSLHIAVKT